jgi:hypothetical protein
MKLIIVNGEPGAGKDSFVDFCIEQLRSMERIGMKVSSVDKVKEAAYLLGWDGEKDAKGRRFLSELKDLATALYDGPMQYMALRAVGASAAGVDAVFFFIREPEEIAKFVERFPGTITVKVHRPGLPQFDNTGDRDVHSYNYDIVVDNTGSLDDLRAEADSFVLGVL